MFYLQTSRKQRSTAPSALAQPARDARAELSRALGLRVSRVLMLACLLLVITEQVIATKAHEPADLQRWKLSSSRGFCPAGSYLSEKSGQCEECEEGVDYTSYSNNLPACIPCRVCAQEETQKYSCNRTTNTVCYCKNGTFRSEGSPEFCQRCQTRCPDGKVMASPCTPWSDLKCMDKESGTKTTEEAPAPGEPVTSSPGTPASPCPSVDWERIVISVTIAIVLLLAGAVFVWKTGWWRLCGQRSIFSRCPSTQYLVQCLKSRTSREELQQKPSASSPRRSSPLPGCEQDSKLGNGVLINPPKPSRGSEAQDNDRNEVLSYVVPSSSLEHDEHEIERQEQVVTGVPEQCPGETDRLLGPAEAKRSSMGRKPLVPASGVDPSEALRRLFTYCTDVVHHNSWDQLMQEMGLTPNEIYLAKVSRPSDPLYEMLQKWLYKTGRNASINTLLGALEKLGQTLAGEKIAEYAVNSGNFIYQED
ncbi:tumor necrosis factor receptor superfamily member 10B isoform X2 [Heterocephalus glaber]|uniref:Tumor necrosis factor receptor superfamily member 10B isoform X2 n=1 Tax=Heterocephalus glaber TaxID=10181 RepID=A0AAX6PCC2_HETGA|nr:tumor necrosis factor receptor superfamily member 10B isoform X2 [Heterocephalus glaber]